MITNKRKVTIELAIPMPLRNRTKRLHWRQAKKLKDLIGQFVSLSTITENENVIQMPPTSKTPLIGSLKLAYYKMIRPERSPTMEYRNFTKLKNAMKKRR